MIPKHDDLTIVCVGLLFKPGMVVSVHFRRVEEVIERPAISSEVGVAQLADGIEEDRVPMKRQVFWQVKR